VLHCTFAAVDIIIRMPNSNESISHVDGNLLIGTLLNNISESHRKFYLTHEILEFEDSPVKSNDESSLLQFLEPKPIATDLSDSDSLILEGEYQWQSSLWDTPLVRVSINADSFQPLNRSILHERYFNILNYFLNGLRTYSLHGLNRINTKVYRDHISFIVINIFYAIIRDAKY